MASRKKTTKRQSKRKSNHLTLNENIDFDFEKAESDIFGNDEELEEVLERQEEIIEQARSLSVPYDKRVLLLQRARYPLLCIWFIV